MGCHTCYACGICDCSLPDLKQCCLDETERLGHAAMAAQQYDEAITQYSAALLLNPATSQDLIMKRSKAYTAKGLWDDALRDANQVGHLCLVQVHSC